MAVPLALLLVQALSVSVADRTEARVRGGDSQTAIDATTQARGSIQLTSQRASWELAYAPTLTQLALGTTESSRLVMQSATLVGRLQLSRRTNAYFSESASYGLQNFRVLSVAAPTVLDAGSASNPSGTTTPGSSTTGIPLTSQTAAVDQTIRYGALTTSGTLSHQLSHRWLGSISTVYAVGGGTDQASRVSIPYMKRLEGIGTITYAASFLDSLRLNAEGTRYSTSLPMTANIDTLEAGWLRKLSPAANASLSVGSAYWSSSLANSDERKGILPVASASFEYRGYFRRIRLQLGASEQLAPMVDRILGTVNQRSTTNLSLEIAHGKLTVLASAFASITDSSMPTTSRYIYGSAQSVAYRLSKHVAAEAGTRQSLLGIGDAGSSTILWASYVAIAYTSGAMRF